MFEFLFDLPLWISGPAIIGVLCIFGLGGMHFVRRRLLPRLQVRVEDSEFSGAIVQSVMVFYGLAVALIAVNVSQTYNDTSKIVSGEAIALNALYRDVTSYPDPIRSELQRGLREYTEQVIQDAWPMQQHGQVPSAGIALMSRFQSTLDTFEPATEGQKLLHGETLRAYNLLIQARRARLDAVATGLPTVMWVVIVLGAFIALTSTFFFQVADARLHGILVVLLATFMGLVVFMILALDRPFRGDLGLGSGPYQLVYEQLMKGKS
jgi:hypothetical protein